ncbi:restriction endonuclease subunit S [Lactobacillus delbrueckii]|uniref:restriction endonuclease subunit S n=1 Tax=Lactobacillus delbrueckii TaxID=1584 RepID=UPI001E3FF7F9|nr:restriction endonuclease subunit S [Lactobacillus delbrueckii]MCD5570891.1 restriction endonuclease subunit S [Lactobacillus delbrueckii subsp. lactis]
MKDEKKAPKLRFKGFTDDWEQRKVSELADRYDNLRVPITASERVAGETPYYGANGIQDYVEGFTHNGEFVLVAEDGANDLQNYPVQYVDGKVWVNNHAHVLQAKEERADNKFLTNALKHTNIEPYLVGGGRAKLNADVMMKINFKVPTLPEQVQIGKFFDNLDHLITLHEEKKRQLERLKSALLQKMFADKSGYPAVRFEGFGGKWDQCKLGNVGTFRGGFGFPENEQGNIDGIAFYKVSDMNDSCNTLTMRKASNYVTSSQISKNKWKPILNQNIIFAKVGAAVYLERKRKAMGPFLLDNNMMAFQPKDADIDYIYYVFQRLRISKHAQVGTLPSLNASELRNITIYIPSLNEQKAVADLMVSLDHTIILYDFKLELLKKLKSSLLQHMFI